MLENKSLRPPKQKFPISFDEQSASNHRIGLGAPPPSWPGESANGERSTKPAWEIKSESEVYIERLGQCFFSFDGASRGEIADESLGTQSRN